MSGRMREGDELRASDQPLLIVKMNALFGLRAFTIIHACIYCAMKKKEGRAMAEA